MAQAGDISRDEPVIFCVPRFVSSFESLHYSVELIEKALKLAPDDSFIIDSMGWVLYRMGDLKDALGYLRRAFGGRRTAAGSFRRATANGTAPR